MKKIFIILAAMLTLAVSCNPIQIEGGLTASLESLTFNATGGTKILSISSESDWTVTVPEDVAAWLTLGQTSGQSGMTSFKVTAAGNTGVIRKATLEFVNKEGAAALVSVTQANAYGDTGEDVSPDPASCITIVPAKPNADSSCVIKFNAVEGNPLYNYAGDLYAHLGVVVDGEWQFVPSGWPSPEDMSANIDKCKFTKVADNSYELELGPTIREFFGSGDTPVVKIAVIVRSDDGTIKSHDADQFNSVTDDKFVLIPFDPDPVIVKTMPAGLHHGVNVNATKDSVTFVLYDLSKSGKHRSYSYVVGDFNDWTRNSASAMYRDDDAGCWWLTIGGIDPDKEYRFNYRLGNATGVDICVADPYSEIIYDQWNDQYILESTYPDLPEFPEGAKALVSAFKINETEYAWQYADYQIEDEDDLVIYELLLRDFSETGDLNGAIEQLDYLETLGINAIELMPIQEFDGNDSWGYNPNSYFALDKAYGTRDMYKKFIDECHKRGIAVLVDVVYNHATGLNTFAKLYYGTDKTTSENPWFNVNGTCAFDVFHDWNHENKFVKEYIKKSLVYLIDEYKIDGFRFDLTKGFTQNRGMEGRYDQSRVNHLKEYYDAIRAADPNAVVILEHFVDDENHELGKHGLKVWRMMNGAYRSAIFGNKASFEGLREDSWVEFGTFVGFMESHDEERLCFGLTPGDASAVSWGICGTLTEWGTKPDIKLSKDGAFFSAKNVAFTAEDMFKIRGNNEWNDMYNYGASSKGTRLPLGKGFELTSGSGSQDMAAPGAGTFDIYFSADARMVWMMTPGQRPADPQIGGNDNDPVAVAMKRAGLNAAFFLTVPGPKMIWQFGELGYDYSINYPSGTEGDRTSRKPVVTEEYMANSHRKALYNTYSGLLNFRSENPRFFDKDAHFEWYVSDNHWPGRYIFGEADGQRFAVFGNFGKGTQTISVDLPNGGPWYDWFTGAEWNGVHHDVPMEEGQFYLLTNFR